MEFKIIFLISALLVLAIIEVQGHGHLSDPVHRGGAWRLGYNTPKNYNDDEQFCGGFGIQYHKNGGKCGVCGDNYAMKQPRDNENGGVYGRGVIVKKYKKGEKIEVEVSLSTAHKGYFEFALCPLRGRKDIETEECFEKYPLSQPNGETRYKVTGTGKQVIKIPLQLPKGLVCDHCTLRWHYRTGNNWGVCKNRHGALGCGDQEIFRSCSDIKIE